MGLALYAFDGTWNTPKDETNVWILSGLYAGEVVYQKGVGAGGLIDKVIGGATGRGTRHRVNQAYNAFKKNWRMGDKTIDIIGFSRGAAAARALATKIWSFGARDSDGDWVQPRIRFLGIFDTVFSMGIPGDDSNIGYNNLIPDNVENVVHAVAGGERRALFPLSSIRPSRGYSRHSGTFIEKEFPGAHSDIGGGYQDNRAAANRVLLWMWQQAKALGVPIREVPEKYISELNEPLMVHDSKRDHELVTPEELNRRNSGRKPRKVYRPEY
jgi:uncharacterized protein (DUF2235 family)